MHPDQASWLVAHRMGELQQRAAEHRLARSGLAARRPTRLRRRAGWWLVGLGLRAGSLVAVGRAASARLRAPRERPVEGRRGRPLHQGGGESRSSTCHRPAGDAGAGAPGPVGAARGAHPGRVLLARHGGGRAGGGVAGQRLDPPPHAGQVRLRRGGRGWDRPLPPRGGARRSGTPSRWSTTMRRPRSRRQLWPTSTTSGCSRACASGTPPAATSRSGGRRRSSTRCSPTSRPASCTASARSSWRS